MILKLVFVLLLVLCCALIECACIHASFRNKDYEGTSLVLGICLLVDSFVVHYFI